MPSGTEPWVAEYLAVARIPVRLACVNRRGWPSLVSLWFLPEDGRLWCATPASAQVVRWLEAEPRCGFEVSGNEMPYRGVRGRGRARLDAARGKPMLRRLVQRYLGSEDTSFARWLLSREEPEVAIAIEIEQLSSWDFTERMEGRS
jgi:nitroimidazol reductase NimA-like FMN-containing flavoprotein (pyridoxamine 5'-phosphate oxidase superfamily)